MRVENSEVVAIVARPTATYHVSEPITEILGGPNIYLEEGNNLNLTCLVKDSPVPPQWIFWYRNSQVSFLAGAGSCN